MKYFKSIVKLFLVLSLIIPALFLTACKEDEEPPVVSPSAVGMMVKYGGERVDETNNSVEVEWTEANDFLADLEVLVLFDNYETESVAPKSDTKDGYSVTHNLPANIGAEQIGSSYAVSISYLDYTNLFAITITKQTENLSLNALGKVYDGTPVEAVVTKTNTNEATIKWYKGETELGSAPTNAGQYKIVVTTQESATVKGATLTQEFEIQKATPSTPAPVVLGEHTYSPTQTLSNISIGQPNHSWKNGEVVPTCDVTTYKAIYNPDAQNYNDLEVDITLNLKKAIPTYTLPTFAETIYSDDEAFSQNYPGNYYLRNLGLPTGFAWTNEAQNIELGTNLYAVTYTPQDQVNYKSVEDEVSLRLVQLLSKPSYNRAFAYMGVAQTLDTNFGAGIAVDETLGDSITQTNVGTYDIVFKLTNTEKYCWEDKSTENFTFAWQIHEYDPNLRFTFDGSTNEYRVGILNNVRAVVIPATYKRPTDLETYPVTTIGAGGFNRQDSILNEIYFLGAIKNIGQSAFASCPINRVYCSSLDNWLGITFERADANPLYCGADLYINGSKLTTLKTNKDINSFAFMGCTSLTTVDFSEGCSLLGSSVYNTGKQFFDCPNITSVIVGDAGLSPSLCDHFESSNFLVKIADGCTTYEVVNKCLVKKDTNTITFVVDGYQLPTTGTYKLSMNAFMMYKNTMTTLFVPAGISAVDFTDYNVSRYSKLKNFKFSSLEQYLNSTIPYITNSPINYATSFTIAGNGISTIEIPSGVQEIGAYLFYGATDLETLKFPASIKTIREGAFQNCGITKIYIDNLNDWLGVSNYSDFGGNNIDVYFNNVKTTSITLEDSLTTIGVGVFRGFSTITQINIPTSVQTIGAYAYAGTGIQEVVFPSALTSIGAGCFANCRSLENVTFSTGMQRVGDGAFKNCTNILRVYAPSLETWLGIEFGGESKTEYADGTNPLDDASSLAFLYLNGKGLTELDMTKHTNITRIGKGAFAGYQKLTAVTISEETLSIGCAAFTNCQAITDIVFKVDTGWKGYNSSGAEINKTLSNKNSENLATFTKSGYSVESEWFRNN